MSTTVVTQHQMRNGRTIMNNFKQFGGKITFFKVLPGILLDSPNKTTKKLRMTSWIWRSSNHYITIFNTIFPLKNRTPTSGGIKIMYLTSYYYIRCFCSSQLGNGEQFYKDYYRRQILKTWKNWCRHDKVTLCYIPVK